MKSLLVCFVSLGLAPCHISNVVMDSASSGTSTDTGSTGPDSTTPITTIDPEPLCGHHEDNAPLGGACNSDVESCYQEKKDLNACTDRADCRMTCNAIGGVVRCAGCDAEAQCGDGVRNNGESCDDSDCANAPSEMMMRDCVKTSKCYLDCTWSSTGAKCLDCGTAAICSDGEINNHEECDDGNLIDTDDCTTKCEPAICGDGTVNTMGLIKEECDPGESSLVEPLEAKSINDCTTSCKRACGDGIKSPVEQCDLEAMNANTGECTLSCSEARCGDSYTQGEEECDEGDGVNDGKYQGCNDNCTFAPRCGDNKVDIGYEECDDGGKNDKGSDGCTPSCKNEYVVFVTEDMFGGQFAVPDNNTALAVTSAAAIAAANMKCAVAAASVPLTGKYEAFLSSSKTNPLKVAKAVPMTTWILRNGKTVGTADMLFAQLIDLENPISVTENGVTLESGYAWTGTTALGDPSTFDCVGWTTNAPDEVGTVGDITAITSKWTNAPVLPACSTPHHLYCFRAE